uniref:Uncharacterized protein n=1 Tax=viral metagenome TaxID=1070528 RepID=A0A6C0D9L9_9ZZZZ
MDDVPSPVRRIIWCWKIEFDRLDALERLFHFTMQPATQQMWQYICEDIRTNTPTYVFDILTCSGTHIAWPMCLYDCDPHKVQTGYRIPISHIVTWRRRAKTIPFAVAK